MNTLFDILKRFALLALQCFILLLILCGNVWLAYTNFAALKVSFEYNGYDMAPLGEETLTGFVWESFGFYNLTIADMFAAAMAFFVAFLSAVVSHHLYRTIRLVMDRRVYARNGQTALVEQADIAIIRDLTYLCLALLPLIPIAIWDMQQFRFRTVVALLGMENNPMAVKDWPFILEQYGNQFAVQLVRIGAWAYIFLIVGAGLLFDLWRDRVGEAYERLVAAIQAWYEYITGTENAEATQTQQAAPTESPDTAYTAQEAQNTADNGSNETVNADTQSTEERQRTAETAGQGAENVEWPERETVKPNYTSTSSDDQNSDEEVTVYGGRPGEKVKFSVAAADPENYYIDEMRRVWKRTFSKGVNEGEPAAAA